MVDADICLPHTWLATCLSSIEEYDVVGGTAVPDGDVTYLYNTFRLTAVGAPATTTVTGNIGLYRRRVFDHVMFTSSSARERTSTSTISCSPVITGSPAYQTSKSSITRTSRWAGRSRGCTKVGAAQRVSLSAITRSGYQTSPLAARLPWWPLRGLPDQGAHGSLDCCWRRTCSQRVSVTCTAGSSRRVRPSTAVATSEPWSSTQC